jgi:hypothetical protein
VVKVKNMVKVKVKVMVREGLRLRSSLVVELGTG